MPHTTFLKQLAAFKSSKEMKEHLVSRFWDPARGFPRDVAVIGASSIGCQIIETLIRRGIHIQGIFDNNPEKHGTKLGGVTVQPLSGVFSITKDLPIILATHRLLGLQKELRSRNFRYVWPFPILSYLDHKYFPGHIFYNNMLEDLFKKKSILQNIARMLNDEESRKTLDRVIGFRLTLDAEIFANNIEPNAYFCDTIFNFCPDEVIIDGGSFNGDSIQGFIARRPANMFKKIIAFEPSIKPFEVLKNNFKNDPRIHAVQACLFERDTTLLFDDSGQRNSSLAIKGKGRRCEALAVDNLAEADAITFIKMNIEGAESKALLGAKRIIKKFHPKLAVAAYHQPKDLWSIPLLIKKLYSGYKLYMRQHDGGIIETVFYAKP